MMVIIAPAIRASKKVRRKRPRMSSSVITRSKLAMICEGSGTMKRLIAPARIRTSIATIDSTNVPSPSTSGSERWRARMAVTARARPRSACWFPR